MRSYIKRSKSAANLIEFNATKLVAVPRMALRCYKRRPDGTGFIIFIIMDKQEDFQGDRFQEIRQQTSTMEKNDDQQRRPHYQERTSIGEFIEYPAIEEDDNLQINDVDDEVALIEKAFEYLTRKTYPPGCSKNDKRIIRRKAEKLEERNGEIFYMKRGGIAVSVTDQFFGILQQSILQQSILQLKKSKKKFMTESIATIQRCTLSVL